MKFMLMMQGTRSGWESMGRWQPKEIEAHIRFMKGLVQELQASRELLLAESRQADDWKVAFK